MKASISLGASSLLSIKTVKPATIQIDHVDLNEGLKVVQSSKLSIDEVKCLIAILQSMVEVSSK